MPRAHFDPNTELPLLRGVEEWACLEKVDPEIAFILTPAIGTTKYAKGKGKPHARSLTRRVEVAAAPLCSLFACFAVPTASFGFIPLSPFPCQLLDMRRQEATSGEPIPQRRNEGTKLRTNRLFPCHSFLCLFGFGEAAFGSGVFSPDFDSGMGTEEWDAIAFFLCPHSPVNSWTLGRREATRGEPIPQRRNAVTKPRANRFSPDNHSPDFFRWNRD